MSQTASLPRYSPARRHFVIGLFGLIAAALGMRAVDLQLMHKDFLQDHGDARYLRTVSTAAHRGMITDRNGEPLAVSTPVDSVWAEPGKLLLERESIPRLARTLDLEPDHVLQLLTARLGREFVYLKRQINPEVAREVIGLGIPGVSLTREFRRYYPTSEVTAHLLGFTNVDDVGQEGLELALEPALRGTSGEKRVVKDRLGRTVENVESIRSPRPGEDIALSIDKRIQYVAYRELKAAVMAQRARAGSIVVLDARTGEVVAMVNQPSYNPNNRTGLRRDQLRNRAVTDVFEPGSTVKPFTVAAALASGAFTPTTPIETGPGSFRVGSHIVKDIHNYGLLDVAAVITKSSNIGVSKIALSLEPERQWRVFHDVGFGAITGSGFPGEASGYLGDYHDWHDLERATLAFGYGLSVTPLQLAQAYQVFASEGVMKPVSLTRVIDVPEGQRVLPASVAREVLTMLESVVEVGTGQLARVPGYRVAGKTGTVHKNTTGGYAEDRYLSLFAGIVPVSAPRLVAVVLIDEPMRGEYYGGRVAAPVFARLMTDTLRLLDVPPDDLAGLRERTMVYASSSPVEESSWAPQ